MVAIGQAHRVRGKLHSGSRVRSDGYASLHCSSRRLPAAQPGGTWLRSGLDRGHEPDRVCSPGTAPFFDQIATTNRDGSDLRVLLRGAKGGRYELDVSPDGRLLAFADQNYAARRT